MAKIEELEQKINELVKELDKLKRQENKNASRFIPQKGQEYWYVDDLGLINNADWADDEADRYRLANMPLFYTKEKVIRYLEFKQELAKRRWSVTKEEWEDMKIAKYYISSDNKLSKNKLEVYSAHLINFIGMLCFKTEEDAEYIINNFEKELLEYWS